MLCLLTALCPPPFYVEFVELEHCCDALLHKVNTDCPPPRLLHSAGHERAHADYRLAICGSLCRQLVWKGEVSTESC